MRKDLTQEERDARNLASKNKRLDKRLAERAKYVSDEPLQIREPLIKLPNNAASRNCITYIKLLNHVAPDRTSKGGFSFLGTLFACGETVPRSALFPTAAYPSRPILLECAGFPGGGRRGRNRGGESLYIVHRLDDSNGWEELGRSVAHAQEWALNLSVMTQRAIAQGGGSAELPLPKDLSEVIERLLGQLELEMTLLDQAAKSSICAVMHDHLAAGIVSGRI
jgi:hypothetical protein